MKSILTLLLVMLLAAACTKIPAPPTDAGSSFQSTVCKNDTCARIDAYLTQLAGEKHFSGGLLIVKDGEKIFSKGYGWADQERKIPFTPRTLASIGSITKAFTAAAIMKLVEQGKLVLQDSLGKFFPQVPADKAGITIHQLLTHSSGFQEMMTQDGGDYEHIETPAYLDRVFAEPLAFKPGEKAVYTNVGMSILGIVIEQVAGMDYGQFLQKELFDGLGIQHLGYRYPVVQGDTIAIGYENGVAWGTHQGHFDKAGGGPFWNLKANGGLEASLDDMFLWINGLTHHKVLQRASIDQMFTAHILEEGYDGRSSFGYGCNILQSRRNTKMIDNGGSNGIYFARMIRLPEEGLVFYMVTNESTINTNMVLPNVTQLYFEGEIKQDALAQQPQFGSPMGQKIYDLAIDGATKDLGARLKQENIVVDNDMILWEVGQKLMQEKQHAQALVLYQYYTAAFPNIVVAWNDMGDVHLALDDTAAAIVDYKQALKIRPGNPRATENLARLNR